MSRTTTWQAQIDWDQDGTYTDESSRLISASGQMRLANPEESLTTGRGMVDRAEIVLSNHDRRYSPLNEAGPLYAVLQDGGAYHAPVRLNVSVDGGSTFHRVFTGIIKLPGESTATTKSTGTIRLECRSRDELLLNARQSSSLADFVAVHSDGYTEEEIMALWLGRAGLVDGVDFVSQAYAAANPGTPATLDVGLWVIPWAWLDDESPLEEIWRLAAAAGGRFYSDPEGVYRYENAAHWLGHDTLAASLTKSLFADLSAVYSDRDLYSGVTVEASPRFALDAGVLWEADGSQLVGAGRTETILAQLRQPALSVESVTYVALTSAGVDISADVAVSFTASAQRVTITVTNNHATQAAILARLALNGQAVGGGPTLEEQADSAHAFWTDRGERRRSIRGNYYIQTQGQAAFLAEYSRDRYQLPRLTFRVRRTPGDPARRLGDRIGLTDPDLMTTGRAGLVTTLGWSLGGDGFWQDLELVDAASLYPYEDDPGYFVIGSNRLGTDVTSSDPGRLFY